MDAASSLLSSLSQSLTKLYPSPPPRASLLSHLPTTPLSILGLLTTTYLTLRTLLSLSPHLLRSSLPKYQHSRPYSTWALITGASDGIGLGFTHALLSKGFNVLLHGRNEAKISALVSTLHTQYPDAQIKTILADASTFSPADIERIRTTASTLPEMDHETIDTIISMNLRFPVHLTRSLLPILQSHQPSLILNVGSGAGEVGIPWLSTYCGAKAFNLRWSQALAAEMVAEGHDGVEVLGILVGNVMSGSNKIGDEFFTCDSRTMAERALGKVGWGGERWGWWRHGVQFTLVGMVPEWVRVKGMAGMMRERKSLYGQTEGAKGAVEKGGEEAMQG
ncbi:hypothetical protein KVT40_000584 [Elsinoe batatas]|uniref:NAD(P)-binding protein n=1 Tax=Elsinoe batatas TaxID=2601811 RepID=A0A8K0L809_9PEZI|nr:hypothetical protein KVT40_000584 [Elsinoe batatas]